MVNVLWNTCPSTKYCMTMQDKNHKDRNMKSKSSPALRHRRSMHQKTIQTQVHKNKTSASKNDINNTSSESSETNNIESLNSQIEEVNKREGPSTDLKIITNRLQTVNLI